MEDCWLHEVSVMEQTLLALKPDAVMRRGVGAAVLQRVLEALPDAKLRGFLEIAVPHVLAEQHYAVHKGKFFYPWLLQFIEVGKVVATVLEDEAIVERLRKVLGATFVEKADAESLRGKYGLVGGVNVAHASDEPANAKQEIALWNRRANLDLAMNGRNAILAYIKQWQDTPVVATSTIRALCREYAQTYTNRARYVTAIKNSLLPECPSWSKREIGKLADAILGNMDLDRKKT
jgi:nucleoside-diphosphate kinase